MNIVKRERERKKSSVNRD